MDSKRKWIDITRTIGEDTLTYPGDQAAGLERRREGNITVTRLHLSSHTGTHLDAPAHFFPGGRTLDQYPVESFFHMAYVLDISPFSSIPEEKISAIFQHHPAVTVILFKTSNSRLERDTFTREFIALSESTAQILVNSGIRLVGIDYLSIETYYTDTYPVHHLLLSNDILILEDVDLREVQEGVYRLTALPLKWKKADGAPARAVLERV